jgi:glycosyltransferase involved in cell wall biosynthesis
MNRIDLVHLNSDPTRHGREIVLAAKLARVSCLCYAQNFSEFQAVDRQLARLIDKYVFCSNAIGEHCIKWGGAVPAQGRTIYPGVPDATKWSGSYETGQLRREFGFSEQDFIVGNIGRLVSWKGQDVFLKALAKAKQHVPHIKGLIVGGPTERSDQQNGHPVSFYEELLALTKALDLEDNVHFAGFRDDIPQILAAVDVFVHSSSEPEPFSTAVIEALMAGRPVVATRAGGMPEMIKDEVTGRLVTIKDPETMAEAILFYHQDPDRAKKIALAGQKRAVTDLTAQRHIQEFHDLYQTIL